MRYLCAGESIAALRRHMRTALVSWNKAGYALAPCETVVAAPFCHVIPGEIVELAKCQGVV
eukprot:COSAG01_NODE_8896_length_2622_cov_43.948474_4_plen_60_part_01